MSLRNFNEASKSIVLPSPAESWLEHTVIDLDSEHHLNVRFRDIADMSVKCISQWIVGVSSRYRCAGDLLSPGIRSSLFRGSS